jgi:hypothetical protein
MGKIEVNWPIAAVAIAALFSFVVLAIFRVISPEVVSHSVMLMIGTFIPTEALATRTIYTQGRRASDVAQVPPDSRGFASLRTLLWLTVPPCLVALAAACGLLPLPPAETVAEVADFRAAGLACVDAGASRAETDRCVGAERVKAGRPFYATDAGDSP